MTEMMQGFNNPDEEPDYSQWFDAVFIILVIIIFINIIKQCTQ